MPYRARFIPTGEYYDRRDYRKISNTGSLFKKLTRKQLMGYLRSSNCKDQYRKMEDWVIEPDISGDGYSFECEAFYGGDATNFDTVLHNGDTITLADSSYIKESVYRIEHGKKYRVTIKEI